MLAVIGDSGNAASIALQRRHGFEAAGLLNSVGWKRGRWVDSGLLQRPLGPGGAAPPVGDRGSRRLAGVGATAQLGQPRSWGNRVVASRLGSGLRLSYGDGGRPHT